MIGDKVTIKMKKIKSFEEIWTSQHTNSREKVSVWEPNFSYALTSKKYVTPFCLLLLSGLKRLTPIVFSGA